MASEKVKASIECLKTCGGGKMVIHSGLAEVRSGQKASVLSSSTERLQALSGYVDKMGVEIARENSPPHALGSTVEEVERILSRLSAYPVSFCLDTGHANLVAGGIQSFIVPGLKPAEVHISDNLGEQDDHLPPGAGAIDWQKILAELYSCFGAELEGLAFTFELGGFPGGRAFHELKRWWETLMRQAREGA